MRNGKRVIALSFIVFLFVFTFFSQVAEAKNNEWVLSEEYFNGVEIYRVYLVDGEKRYESIYIPRSILEKVDNLQEAKNQLALFYAAFGMEKRLQILNNEYIEGIHENAALTISFDLKTKFETEQRNMYQFLREELSFYEGLTEEEKLTRFGVNLYQILDVGESVLDVEVAEQDSNEAANANAEVESKQSIYVWALLIIAAVILAFLIFWRRKGE